MAAPLVIQRITSLKGLGVFRDYTAAADLPALRTYNLIYGFNGSGKTTLSRVFSSLGAGTVRPELPERGSFEIELSDGSSIKSSGNLDGLKGRLLVFDIDFIEENLRWKEGTANPVFHLGKEQAELANKLEDTGAKIAALGPKLMDATKDHERKERTFSEHKRSSARLVAEQLGLGRKYDASNLDADYAAGNYDETYALPEAERLQQRSIITQDTPLPKRPELSAEPFDLAGHVRQARKILDSTLGTMTVEDLREHEAMLKWVKEAVDYHQAHHLRSCLFCGNDLMDERVRALREAIDERFDTLTGDIAASKANAEGLRDRLAAMKGAIPSRNDLAKELQASFPAAGDDLHRSLTAGAETVRVMLALLEKKAARPNVRVDSGTLQTDAQASAWDTTAGERLLALNSLIKAHNRSHDNFNSVQETARAKLKEHLLAEDQAKYREAEADVAAATTVRDDLDDERKRLEQDGERLKEQMRQHGPAAGMINRMISSYLGHKELEIGTLTDGYQLCRNGKPVTGSLSEGEKTAIALCYFLSTVEAEGRKRKDEIVVLDDPISSLDTRALNYAFSIIKAALSDAGQLILMTHNLHFMNEAKKWLKKKTEKEAGTDRATATLLFLDVVQKDGADTRSSSIKEMPKYIREYESEYQYLFHLVLQFSQSPDGQTGYFYVMPNALRKVLEIFLAFKRPGSEGLSAKVDAVANGDYGLDAGRIHALDRLVQLESHSDNLDDLVTFSSMTIEETKHATNALLELMATLDRSHYDHMCRICRL